MLTVVIAAALLLLGVAKTPALAVTGYLLFSATFFTAGMLLVSSYADLLPVRQLAVGTAAINTLWQIGAFLSPYAWGVTKDATGSFRAANQPIDPLRSSWWSLKRWSSCTFGHASCPSGANALQH